MTRSKPSAREPEIVRPPRIPCWYEDYNGKRGLEKEYPCETAILRDVLGKIWNVNKCTPGIIVGPVTMRKFYGDVIEKATEKTLLKDPFKEHLIEEGSIQKVLVNLIFKLNEHKWRHSFGFQQENIDAMNDEGTRLRYRLKELTGCEYVYTTGKWSDPDAKRPWGAVIEAERHWRNNRPLKLVADPDLESEFHAIKWCVEWVRIEVNAAKIAPKP